MIAPEQARMTCEMLHEQAQARRVASAWWPLPGCSAGPPGGPHVPSGLPVPPRRLRLKPPWLGRSFPRAAHAPAPPRHRLSPRRRGCRHSDG